MLSAKEDFGRGDALKALEARYGIPYRDPTATRALAEACLALPPEAFLKNGQKRALAREMARGRMPEAQRLASTPDLTAADARRRVLRARPALAERLTLMAQDEDIAAVIDPAAIAQRLASLDADDPCTLSDHVFCSAGLPAAIAAGTAIARSKGLNAI